MFLKDETQRAVDSAVREVFQKAAAFDELYPAIRDWLDQQGVRIGWDRQRHMWLLQYSRADKVGIPVGKYPTFTQAFERALQALEEE